MSEEKKKVSLAEMLGEAGIELAAVAGSKNGIRSGVAFGTKEPLSEAIMKMATKRSLWEVTEKKQREKWSKAAQDEAKKKLVKIVDWKLVRRACNAEIERMQKNLGTKPKVISADIAASYGVYRTNENGEFVVCQKSDQGRRMQMISCVKRLAGKLEAEGVDFVDAGNDKSGPVLVIEE